jgi:AcrR family transcriptional regulator
MTPVATTAATTRERILEATLDLTSSRGSAGMSMRELAGACGVNVAALYYHFPSKADLLRAVIEERQYDTMMAEVVVPPRSSGTDRQRLVGLMRFVWEGLEDEERVWRLLLAESCHNNDDAQDVARSLVQRFEELAGVWLHDEFGPLVVPEPIAARLLADFLFANLARMAIGAVTAKSITDDLGSLADVIFGDSDQT